MVNFYIQMLKYKDEEEGTICNWYRIKWNIIQQILDAKIYSLKSLLQIQLTRDLIY